MRQNILIPLLILIGFGVTAQINFDLAKNIGGSSIENSRCIAVDASGNIYVTGDFRNTSNFDLPSGSATLTSVGQTDVFIAKFDANGNYIWAKQLGGTGYDYSYGLVLDASNNIYVTGYFNGTADFNPSTSTNDLVSVGGSDIFIAKYDVNGDYIWSENIGSPYTDFSSSIAIDGIGDLYITGTFGGIADFDPSTGNSILTATSGNGVFLAKYSTSGNYIWAKTIIDSGTNNCYDVALDVNSNAYITGAFIGTKDFDASTNTTTLTSLGQDDIFLAKYDANGNYVWAKNIGGTGIDFGYGVSVDGIGNSYVTGYFNNVADFDPSSSSANLTSVGADDVFIAKYDPNGNYLWAKNIGGNTDDVGYNITNDGNGNLFITGYFQGTADFDPSLGSTNLSSAGGFDIFLAKYDLNGNYVFAKNFGNTNTDFGYCVVLDNSGKIYLSGVFGGVVDFDPSSNNFYLSSVGNSLDGFFAKYSQAALGVSDFEIDNIKFYPNPTNGKLTLTTTELYEFCDIIITNVLGEKIFQKEYKNTSLIQLDFEGPEGIYFLNFKSEHKTNTIKLLKQ